MIKTSAIHGPIKYTKLKYTRLKYNCFVWFFFFFLNYFKHLGNKQGGKAYNIYYCNWCNVLNKYSYKRMLGRSSVLT